MINYQAVTHVKIRSGTEGERTLRERPSFTQVGQGKPRTCGRGGHGVSGGQAFVFNIRIMAKNSPYYDYL